MSISALFSISLKCFLDGAIYLWKEIITKEPTSVERQIIERGEDNALTY
jgi:hypothetical protein